MASLKLTGHSILIVEDEPLISMDIAQAFRAAGAKITITNTLTQALVLVEHDSLTAAILDHALADGDSTRLCERLKERNIPFVIYSGFSQLPDSAVTRRASKSPPRASWYRRWKA
jgi:DNA-binding response OmpR family regulator